MADAAADGLVRSLLGAFEAQDIALMATSFHRDVTFELPFEDRFVTKVGIEAVLAHFRHCFDPEAGLFASLAFEVEALVHDPEADVSVAQYRSRGVLREFGADYENAYVGVFALRDGLVVRWQEYANPLKGTSRRLEALRRAASSDDR